MYGRINGSSNIQSSHSPNSDNAEDQSFTGMLEGMHIAARGSHASSSSAASRPYSLVSDPPGVELSQSSFAAKVKDFYGDEIQDIAARPQSYSRSVSLKAERAADVAYNHGRTDSDSKDARYFSYQLGNTSVGLLRTEGIADDMSDVFEGEQWQQQFPGRIATSVVSFQVTHPLVDNAGDILLEHLLRRDGERPLLLSHPINEQAKARTAALGFGDVGHSMMALDQTRHGDEWTKNSEGKWQRKDKPPLYLSTIDDGERNAHHASPARAPAHAPEWDDDLM